jgi:hypothetical protein
MVFRFTLRPACCTAASHQNLQSSSIAHSQLTTVNKMQTPESNDQTTIEEGEIIDADAKPTKKKKLPKRGGRQWKAKHSGQAKRREAKKNGGTVP